MKKLIPILIFVIGQLASVAILVLYIVMSTKVEGNLWWLLNGIFLMVAVIGGTTLMFIFWSKSRMLDTERANFISSVSHELLTPLASMRLYTETMAIRELTDEKRAEFLDLMLNDADRLNGLISQILNASKLERGKTLFHFEECNLDQVIQEFIQANNALVKTVDLSLDLDSDCYVKLDKDSFEMMLKNLIENAIRYSPEPASIAISLKRKGGKLLLQIKDQGEGLDPKEAKKVFRLFYRVSRKRGGTGLGLFIVSMVVKAHKGKVWAYSEGLDQGTSMNVQLPALAANGEVNA